MMLTSPRAQRGNSTEFLALGRLLMHDLLTSEVSGTFRGRAGPWGLLRNTRR